MIPWWRAFALAACLGLSLVTLATGSVQALPTTAGISQFDSHFPDVNPTDGLQARNRRVFRAYGGQGTIHLINHGATAAKAFVNGRPIELKGVLARSDGQETLDIGKMTQTGDNTFKVLDVEPQQGWIEARIPYPTLTTGQPKDVGISQKKLDKVDNLILRDVANGFPGAVLLVTYRGKIIKESAYGWAKEYDRERLLPERWRQPMTVHTMFDLASNTKMYATILAFMKLTEEGRVNPADLVCKYLPQFTGGGRERIRLCDVMAHTAGFSPSAFFYKPQSGPLYSLDRVRTEQLLNQVPLVYPTGTKTLYSDTDYMLLGTVIEKITGQRLDDYVEQTIYQPLGLTRTAFNPLQKGFLPKDMAATEPCGNTRSGMVWFPGIRTDTLQGQVHDENAWYSMGGVSGHAGLFSQARDLAVLTQLLLNKGGYGEYRLCSARIVSRYTRPGDGNPRFGLGWNIGGLPERIWEFGPYAGDEAFGHTGWTGTDIIIDPRHDLAIILLTNRIHEPNVPGQVNTFQTDDFETCSYGSIPAMIYEAILE